MTTDDEAFIRSVVDSPGDDLPRLAYADWLDDRSDPRGVYLRTEYEWAKPWRHGERPVSSPELLALAFDLDRVWVARVSRPPVGVCCEHMRFDDGGPRLDSLLLAKYEEEVETFLPDPYRAFLLNQNGGTPHPDHLPVPGGRRNRMEAIRRFFPLTVDRRCDGIVPSNLGYAHDHLYGALMRPVPHARRPFLPVAWFGEVQPPDDDEDRLDATGRRILLGIRGPRCGEVHLLTQDGFSPGGKTRRLASTWGEFLRIVSQHSVPLTAFW